MIKVCSYHSVMQETCECPEKATIIFGKEIEKFIRELEKYIEPKFVVPTGHSWVEPVAITTLKNKIRKCLHIIRCFHKSQLDEIQETK